ncbi:MAG: J domain-containing protein, partial [Kofleriaceae bacterium]
SAVPILIPQDPDVSRRTTPSRTVTNQAMASAPRANATKRDNRTVPVATRELAELIAKSSSPRAHTRGEVSRPEPRSRERQMTDPFLEVQATKMRPPALDLEEIRELIEVGTILLERSVDHFSYLGLSFDAPTEEVRDAYLEFARYLRPEKLAELGLVGQEAEDANAVFAQVIIAYTVLTDPHRRREYMAMLESTRARARR